jgi:hypothetical protein
MEFKRTDTGAVPLSLQQEAARFGSMGRSGMHGPRLDEKTTIRHPDVGMGKTNLNRY